VVAQRSRPVLGLFQGGFRPTTSFTDAANAAGHQGQSTATFISDEFTKLSNPVPHSSNQGICDAVHLVGAGLTSSVTPGTGQYGDKDDYIPHHQPFQYYASTTNPHHLTRRIPVIVVTPEVFGSCDGWGSAGSGAADGEA
jgi:phospholipase C